MSSKSWAGAAVLLSAAILAGTPAVAQEVAGTLADAIVGTWVGEASQGDTKFETRLTFVSPKGGVSRYPGYPCGGMLTGDRKGDGYEFNEVITWGGTDETPTGCIGGIMRIALSGNTMNFDWSTNYNGQDLVASGELHRVDKAR
jgi:hypothetical protein